MLRHIRAVAGRFQNLLFVALAVGLGVLVPGFGAYLDPLVTPLVIFLVYSSLRGWQFDEIEFSSYGALVFLSVGISYVLLPVGGVRIADTLLAESAVMGFAITLSAPTTAGSAIIWTRFSDADVQLSTTISISSILLAPIATPLVLTRLVETQASIPVRSLLLDLLVIIVGGVALAVLVPTSAVSERTVDRGSTLAILLLIYTSIAGIDVTGIPAQVLLALVAASLLVLGFGLVVSLLCGRGLELDQAAVLPLFFTSSLKNLGIALLIAISFTEPLVVVAIITYYVVQQVFGALTADVVT